MQQGNDVQLKENAENSVRASAKGKSLKTSTKQATRKQLLESQKSQSSQDIVTSSQSQPNSDDEFKPRRTKRNTQKKSYKWIHTLTIGLRVTCFKARFQKCRQIETWCLNDNMSFVIIPGCDTFMILFLFIWKIWFFYLFNHMLSKDKSL